MPQVRKLLPAPTVRFQGGITDFKEAAANRRIREVEKAFAELSVSYDRCPWAG